MAGKRAPELACGGLRDALCTIADAAQQSLLKRCAEEQVSPQDMGEIVGDFVLGCDRMKAGVTAKTSHWQEFPWRLCALAHWDEVLVQRHAVSILQDFDGMFR